MILIQAQNISKNYVLDEVLSGLDFEVQSGEHIGLIGRNGSGKSTLFNILTGELAYDAGEVRQSKSLRIGYLRQNEKLEKPHLNVYAYCLEVYRELLDLYEQMLKTSQQLAAHPHDEDLLGQYAEEQHAFEEKQGYQVESKVRGILIGLGFSPDDFSKPIHLLSGGELTRLHLARLLLETYDVLLLDEPTNHLDIRAIRWLEDFLQTVRCAYVIITHDRVFLDKTVQKIYEIEQGRGTWYEGNYSAFVEQKRKHYESALHAYEQQQKKMQAEHEKLRVFQERSHRNQKFSARAKDRAKKISRIDLLHKPLWLDQSMHLDLKISRPSGKDVLTIEHLGHAFSQDFLFRDLTLKVHRGDVLGIIGPNGIGKSTLLKILRAEILPKEGNFLFGTGVELGYYDQTQQHLNENVDLVTELNEAFPHLDLKTIRNLLAAFLFTQDDVFKKIKQLSGGERARLALLKLMLEQKNVLLLDEPTNHLDLVSKETLEKALHSYPGTLILVSHDRYFLNQCCTRILALETDGHRLVEGNYDTYMHGLTPAPRLIESEPKKAEKKSSPKNVSFDLSALKLLLEEEKLREIELVLCEPDIYNDSQAYEKWVLKKQVQQQLVQSMLEAQSLMKE